MRGSGSSSSVRVCDQDNLPERAGQPWADSANLPFQSQISDFKSPISDLKSQSSDFKVEISEFRSGERRPRGAKILSRWMLWGGPLIAGLGTWLSAAAGMTPAASWCAGVALLCALWWIFESLPIAAVGLVPFVVFPLTGVMDHSRVATSYGHSMILLMMGGFFLSAAMERSGAHRRIALVMVRAVGGRGGRRLVLGFMLATAGLSMWISNTAATLMILPIAVAVLRQTQDDREMRVALLLGVAYAASVGGMGTPVGTPPNVLLMGVLAQRYERTISFPEWMAVAMPIVVVLLPSIWWWITRRMGPAQRVVMPEVGRWRPAEVRVLTVFAFTAAAWIFRQAPYGGWAQWMPGAGIDGTTPIGDATVALAASLALFVLPAGRPSSERQGDAAAPADAATADDPPAARGRLLDWETAQRVPWGILVMFGGGLALAAGFEETGLSAIIGQQLRLLSAAPLWVVILAVCLLVTFMTEITSSTATTALLLPILAGMSDAMGWPPELIMIPGTISASCAFMLPVATPPNTIIFGAGGISTGRMARTGLVLNLFAAALITLVCWGLVG